MSQRVTRSTASQMLFNENSNDSMEEGSGDDALYNPRQERQAPRDRTRPATGQSQNWIHKNRSIKTQPYKLEKEKVGNFYAPKWVKLSDEEERQWREKKELRDQQEEQENAENENGNDENQETDTVDEDNNKMSDDEELS